MRSKTRFGARSVPNEQLASLVAIAFSSLTPFARRSMNPSAALYPAGASRYEPVGVVICASVMGMGSLLLIKESVQQLVEYAESDGSPGLQGGGSSTYSLAAVIVLKAFLSVYCKATAALLDAAGDGESTTTIDAMYQDHFNDGLSNCIALVAIWVAVARPDMWWFDPMGAVFISLYIIKSWYETGMEEIDKIVGKGELKSGAKQRGQEEANIMSLLLTLLASICSGGKVLRGQPGRHR